MPDTDTGPSKSRNSLVERRARKIANARSVTLGLACTFVLLALAGAFFMRIADPDNFPSIGVAVWWALQTITTVGYGDVVPTTVAGRVVAGVEMVTGVSFIAFLTAAVTSTVIQRGEADSQAAAQSAREASTKAIMDAVSHLNERLDAIEQKLPG
jgi:voltage-gated potassium channel